MDSAVAPASAPIPKWQYWTGWALSILASLMLLMSAVMKLIKHPEVIKGWAHMGYPESVGVPIGITEGVCTLLYLIPQTRYLGGILLAAYLGGAVATHVRLSEPFHVPIIIGVLLWIGLWLRDTRFRALAPITR